MNKEDLKRRRATLKAQSDELWKDINEHHNESLF